jgi:hypothetical protein
MYVNWNFGEVRLLTIDAATGLPVDKGTGQPTLGTTNPTDSRFASGLGVGPWGLEFDPRTNDFFVATFRGDPTNSIVQIGGVGFPPPSTTTTSTTTTSSKPGSSTTTTTLSPGCAGAPAVSFVSIICRLDALTAALQAATDLGATKTPLLNGVSAARSKTQAGSAASSRKKASNALKKAARKMIGFNHRLRSLRSRKNIPDATRAGLLAQSEPILADMKTLRKQL